MPQSEKPSERRLILVAHPGAELYGSDRMALESVRGLVESGHDVIVALPESGPLVAELVAAGARVVLIPMLVLRKALLRPRNWLRLVSVAFRSTISGLKLLKRTRPTTVYVSTLTLPLWPPIARVRRIPVVSHVHEAESSAPDLVNKALYAPHLLSSRVLINSEFSRSTLETAYPALARRTEIVYNGVAGPDSVTPVRAELTDGVRLIYVGRLSPRKGVADVIEAVAVLRDRGLAVHLTVLGSAFEGYEWFATELADLVRDRELSSNVVFRGFEDDIWPIVAEHDIMVVPSRLDEPFGNTAVEGILAGRIVIATDTSGLREAAGGYRTTSFVPPESPQALADAVHADVDTWLHLSADIDADRRAAIEKHSPEGYRSAISTAVDAVRAPTG